MYNLFVDNPNSPATEQSDGVSAGPCEAGTDSEKAHCHRHMQCHDSRM